MEPDAVGVEILLILGEDLVIDVDQPVKELVQRVIEVLVDHGHQRVGHLDHGDHALKEAGEEADLDESAVCQGRGGLLRALLPGPGIDVRLLHDVAPVVQVVQERLAGADHRALHLRDILPFDAEHILSAELIRRKPGGVADHAAGDAVRHAPGEEIVDVQRVGQPEVMLMAQHAPEVLPGGDGGVVDRDRGQIGAVLVDVVLDLQLLGVKFHILVFHVLLLPYSFQIS